MIYDKNNKYLPSFIVSHKYTINKMYLVRLMWWRTKFFVKISPPCHVSTRSFREDARDFQMICFVF